MDMDYVGIDCLQRFHELSRSPRRAKTMTVEGARDEAMKRCTPFVAHRQYIRCARTDTIASFAVSTPVMPTGAFC